MSSAQRICKMWLPAMISLGIFVMSFGWMGCSFDTSGLPVAKPDNHYECKTELWHCDRLPDQKPKVDLTLGFIHFPDTLTKWENAVSYPVMAEKGKTYAIYHDKDVVIYDMEYDDLKGALLIAPGFDDWKNDFERFLDVKFGNDIEEFYVAYDSRANTPRWLTSDYQALRGPAGNTARIVTSLLDKQGAGGKTKFLTLDIFHYRNPLAVGNVVTLPGASYDFKDTGGTVQKKDWKEIKSGNPLMYVLLVQPKVRWDCSSGKKIDTEGWEDCVPAVFKPGSLGDPDYAAMQKIAEKDANRAWKKEYPYLTFQNTSCQPTATCSEAHTLKGGALTVQPRSYVYSSEVEFVAPSKADVKIKNHQYKQPVRGKLHFEYLKKTRDIQLNSMIIRLAPMSTDFGKFENIVFYLIETATADCQGQKIYDKPCNQYSIPQYQFVCAESFLLDGKPRLFVSQNSQAVPISIDHATKTFTITGKLSSNAVVDGKTIPIDVSLNLTGKFVNFTPVPVGDESDRYSQCVEGKNMHPIHLDASGSFDVYTPLPIHPATYQWYEDYGLVTEKKWGQGKKATIGPGELGFGAHDITLAVEDAHGVTGTDTFTVEVVDTLPPTLSVPQDIHILLQNNPGAVKVNIGKAYASDGCSTDVMITNDAPAGMMFPPGQITNVTWFAEDLRGNIAKGVQKIHIFIIKPYWPDLAQTALHLAESINKSRFALIGCGNSRPCMLDLEPLTLAMDQVMDLMEELPLPDAGKDRAANLRRNIPAAREMLLKAQELVNRSNKMEEDRCGLRQEAGEYLKKTVNHIAGSMKASINKMEGSKKP